MICAFTEAVELESLVSGDTTRRGECTAVEEREPLHCLFQLKSATEDAQVEQDSAICLLPGNGLLQRHWVFEEDSFACTVTLPSLLLVNNDLSSLSSSPLLLGLATTHAV
ncbi:hypothetical protein Q3G72_030291 [Acer saccharum]|nr:hypothetical protein Q3G72_030291 [Acer saccharum]